VVRDIIWTEITNETKRYLNPFTVHSSNIRIYTCNVEKHSALLRKYDVLTRKHFLFRPTGVAHDV
jgi:hypothetical protein